MSNIDEIAATFVQARQDIENARKKQELAELAELAEKTASIASWAESASRQACKHAALQEMLTSAKIGLKLTRMSDRTFFQLCKPADNATLKTMLSSSKHTVDVERSWRGIIWLHLVDVEKSKPVDESWRDF